MRTRLPGDCKSKASWLVLMALIAMVSAGCSSDVGSVSGKVTINGEPIDNATVMFYPDQGRASVGHTDSAGRYTLNYTQGRKGAVIGSHKVTISTEVFAEEDRNVDYDEADQAPIVKGRPESMPPKYLDPDKTVLSAVVNGGSNTIDFDLEL
ncbi:MAG: carboxypeptidase-like regulatory domain-containing protein [Planctomycetota bacterium]